MRLSFFFLVCAIYFLSIKDAYAYLDPGTGSMILQSVIAVCVGAIVAMKVYWHKLKSFFVKNDGDRQTDKEV